MKQNYASKFSLFFACFLSACALNAQNFQLVKDINTFTDANPSNYQWPTTPVYAVLNGAAYFSADDGINGRGFWRTDGTAGGTTLVKTIAPDTSGTLVQNITPYKNMLVFSVTDNERNQIWISDGTTAGTKVIKDLPYVTYQPTQFTLINGEIYFVYSGISFADQLWRTDGTDTGTVLIASFFNSTFNNGYGIGNLTNYHNTAYFAISTNNGGSLFKSNGTAGGTEAVFTTGQFGLPLANLTVLGDTLYFAADHNNSISLWKTDGTAAGTTVVPGSGGTIDLTLPNKFPVVKNVLYFSLGNTIYKYDTKNAADGVQLVTAVNAGSVAYGISNFTAVNDSLLFFNTADSLRTPQLWRSDGTGAGTVLLKAIPGTYYSFFQNFYAINKTLFFSCYGDNLGFELWKTDGSVSGTALVKDINPGLYSSNPSYCTAFGQSVLFNANDGVTGYELWKTDGTENGTTMVKDINITSTASATPFLDPFYRSFDVTNNNQVIFEAFDDLHGTEPWKSDGSSAGTSLVKDVIPGYLPGAGEIILFTNFKKNSYFFGQSLNDSISLWKTDGTAAGTLLAQNFANSINDIYHTGQPRPVNMAANDSLLFIQVWDQSSNRDQLWVSNGSFPAKQLKTYTLSAAFSGSQSPSLYFLGNSVLFGSIGPDGLELWKTDGTVAGTVQVKTITPAPGYTNFIGTVYKNKLYFAASNGTGTYLWVSDGTAAGTYVFKPLQIDTYAPLTIANGKLYFKADDGVAGAELWQTDGTETGTIIVKDIQPGANSSGVYNLINVNGTLFFTANDGIHGNELWKSDGTGSGTVMVKDITPGINGTNFANLVTAGNVLYFLISGALWVSDGTDAGTVPVTDSGLQGLRSISQLTGVGNNLYFTAYTYKYGNELYIGKANSALPLTLLSFTGEWAKKDAQLTWVTTNEHNTSHFTVQRSITGANFAGIGQVKASGASASTNTYRYTDVNAAELGSNSVFYRLQQVDLDGKTTYSNIIRLNINGGNNVFVTPNPAQKTAFINSAIDITSAVITVTDMSGRTVYTATANLHAGTRTPLNIASLAAGVYTITIKGSNQVKQQTKLVVQ